ncbi:MarR family winged helix-turn-helix transcriptional regulator [Sporomusa termitida]|uniref:Transcriptional regulator SlyA n=1 Tax=Sporomusa termitida TaxID=2377 RepID=A0A517DQA7_9FIRM|nr:MarR family transcriptional regulator [Sporomusa termitida]QDR79545.1 Transcriptional regulator SlyA [Sporomusa termitida]
MKQEYPDQYICFRLNKAMRVIQRYYERHLTPLGITPSQFYVLSYLWVNNEAKFKDLAKSVNIEGSTLTGILDRLERNRFILRQDDPEDRRSIVISLTAKAREVIPQGMEFVRQLDAEVLRNLLPMNMIKPFKRLY